MSHLTVRSWCFPFRNIHSGASDRYGPGDHPNHPKDRSPVEMPDDRLPDSTATAENSTSAACPGLIFEPLSDFQTEKDVTSNKVLYQNVALQNFPLR